MSGTFFSPTRALLKKLLPDPGEGPNKRPAIRGFSSSHGTDRENAQVKVTGQRDQAVRPLVLAQAGLCLTQDELAVGGGIWTPASALGDALLARLPDVDIHFAVMDEQ